VVFFADDHALLELFRQHMVLKGLSWNFPASRRRCQD